MNFVANLPYTKVWVKKEYLYDLEKGFDEEPVEGVLVAVKSMQGRALMFEVYLLNMVLVMISFLYQHYYGRKILKKKNN